MNKIEFYSNLAKFQGRNGDAFLKHYGILGQKWGQRRWQNADGTFNEEGKERYFGSKGNKEEKVDEKADKSSKNKWSMNDLFKKAGYNYDNSDDETRELFEMEIDDIRSSYKNGNDINKLSKEFGYDKKFIQDVINSDPDQKVGSDWDKEKHMEHFNNWNKVGKKIGIDGSDVRIIYDSNEELYDDNAMNAILKNSDKINKMNKALEKGNNEKYYKIRNTFEDDYEKDIAESFIQDKFKLKMQQAEIKHLQNQLDSNKNTKGKIEISDEDFMKDIYPSDMLKDPKKLEIFKSTVNDFINNYDKHFDKIKDGIADKYYDWYLSYWESNGKKPISKAEFKSRIDDLTGTIKPSGEFEFSALYKEGDSKYVTDAIHEYYSFYDIINNIVDTKHMDSETYF